VLKTIKRKNNMNHLKLFENFQDLEGKIEELDNWIESNIDYINPTMLVEKLKEILQLGDELTEETIFYQDDEGLQYGEKWGKNLVTIKMNGKDLMLIWLTSDMSYDFGKNTLEFGGFPKDKIKEAPFGGGARFFFDRTIL
jgi:hypothetical protein